MLACFDLELGDHVSNTGRLTNARGRSAAIEVHASSLDAQPPSAGWPPQGGAVWLPPPSAKLAPLSERPCTRVRFSSSSSARLSIPDKHRRPPTSPEGPGSRWAGRQAAAGAAPTPGSVRRPPQGAPRGAALQASLERLVLQQQSSAGAEGPQEPAQRRPQAASRFASVLAAQVEAVQAQRSSTAAAAAAAAGFASPGRQVLNWDEGVPSDPAKVSDRWVPCTLDALDGPWTRERGRLEARLARRLGGTWHI